MLSGFNWLETIGSSPIFMFLIGLSVVGFGIVIERAIYFWKRRGDPAETLADTLEKLRVGSTKEATQICRQSPHPMGPVVAQVLDSDPAQPETMEERLIVALSEQKLLLERNVGALGSIAAIAPLVGLLGTVWGIMRAFQDMAVTGSAAPSIVAAGVSEALTTTAAGLIIGVPAVLLYNYFTRRTNVMLTVAENSARHVRNAMVDPFRQFTSSDTTSRAA